MARNLQVGDTVFVPKAKIGLDTNDGSALKECKVIAVNNRTITLDINDPNGNGVSVASSAAHRNIRVLVIRIGDFISEGSFLDPLAKSILQFLRVLLTDDFVHRLDIRSIDELAEFWKRNHGTYSHIVIVGHGSPDGFSFGVGGLVGPERFLEALEVSGHDEKIIVSLACKTGRGMVAKRLSGSSICSTYLAPYNSVHGADASLYVQTFLALHFLEGLSSTVAAKRTYDNLPKCYFRSWQKGSLKNGYHVR